jgi:hypothetical protein
VVVVVATALVVQVVLVLVTVLLQEVLPFHLVLVVVVETPLTALDLVELVRVV